MVVIPHTNAMLLPKDVKFIPRSVLPAPVLYKPAISQFHEARWSSECTQFWSHSLVAGRRELTCMLLKLLRLPYTAPFRTAYSSRAALLRYRCYERLLPTSYGSWRFVPTSGNSSCRGKNASPLTLLQEFCCVARHH